MLRGLQWSRAPKSPVTPEARQKVALLFQASMEPGSEEPGDRNHGHHNHRDNEASMEPGSEEPGDPNDPRRRDAHLLASMEPGSEEPGDYSPTIWRGCRRVRFNGAGLRRAR